MFPDEGAVVWVISRRTLVEFWEIHADAEQPLRAWFQEAKAATWDTPTDIKACYASASFLADNRVVFNIGGNKYRLVVWINYRGHRVFIKFVGTHAEYDEVDAETIGGS